MAMFQKGIIDKYLREIDKDLLDEKYSLFKSIFFSSEKQKNIRESKEEQYQEGFIRDLFCRVLGYTIKPEANYNILTELKNETSDKNNAKKSDAAIIIKSEVKAVIELKGTNTTDLNRVAFQAFSYKNHHENCPYVIVSNFERLRFYVETQIDFIEFDLFHLSKENFGLLYLLLSLESVTSDIALKLKHETLSEEKNITEAFYRDYSAFKRELFEDICSHNSSQDRLYLFKKTQKLLDRILFILFCEDRGLLPANSVKGIISDFKNLKKMGFYQSLYNVFKNFFERINHGFSNPDDHSRDVFAYNGGLFKSDEVLDSITVSDDVLLKHCSILSDYDFQSQISVDILGRIFENSLSEIEEIIQDITQDLTPNETVRGCPAPSRRGEEKGEKSCISKRKKDGVFYTPEYITKYIVENTIARLCEEKREELKIKDEEFDKGKGEKSLDERLSQYREWLLELKILDPACGSGAFLNAALKQLQKEHDLIAKYWAKLHQNELYFENIDNVILENNLFGVDINEESVEIAKLSLWLSTAKKNRKLSTLANNIKCGNSLISDKAVAGEKAFDWKNEFSSVFEKGGFDVIIGNPPWGAELDDVQKKYLASFHDTSLNTAYLFIEKGLSLIKESGKLFFIIPKGLSYVPNLKSMREFLKSNYNIESIIDTSESFKSSGVELEAMMILVSKKQVPKNIKTGYCLENKFITSVIDKDIALNDENFAIWLNGNNVNIVNKVKSKSIHLGNICTSKRGIGVNKYVKFDKDASDVIVLGGKTISRYALNFLTYAPSSVIEEKHNWCLVPKIILQEIVGRVGKPLFGNFRNVKLNAALDEKGEYYTLDTVVNLFDFSADYDIKYVLAILNCDLTRWYFHVFQKNFSQLTIHSGNENSRNIPIPAISLDEQKPFVALADKMLSLNEQIQKKSAKFISRVKDNLNVQKISSALESFYALTFAEFAKELGKQKVKLTLKEQDEWEEYFDEYKAEISALKADADATDKAINAAVYALYGLSAEEIAEIEKV